eukprot:8190068-Alexandrium_andersonii.AAC.1
MAAQAVAAAAPQMEDAAPRAPAAAAARSPAARCPDARRSSREVWEAHGSKRSGRRPGGCAKRASS